MRRRWIARMVLLAMVAICNGCGEYREKTVEIGYKGKARRDPFLAATRLLNRLEMDAESTRISSRLPSEYGMLFVPLRSLSTVGGARRYLNWASEGGHLVVAAAGMTMFGDWGSFKDWKPQSDLEEKENSGEHPFFSETGLRAVKKDGAPVTAESSADTDDESGKIEIEGKSFDVEVPSELVFYRDHDGEESATPFVTMEHDYGRVSILATARPLRNRYIDERDHAAFLVALAKMDELYRKDVVFMQDSGLSFWSLLWKYGWAPMCGLLVLTALWLWKNVPRFGPVLGREEQPLRSFLSHIDTGGRFLWRHGHGQLLLEPLRQGIYRRLEHLHPGDAAQGYQKGITLLVDRSGLERERIEAVLKNEETGDSTVMSMMVRDLRTLEDCI